MNRNIPGFDPLLTFSAVYACIQIISGDVAKLPVQFFDIIPSAAGVQPVRRLNTTYPTNNLLRMPNAYQNRMQFMQALVISYLTTGNVYLYVKRDARQLVREIHVLDPLAVWPHVAPEDGSLYYKTGDNLLAGIRGATMIPARDMGHIRMQVSPSHPLVGMSPIYAAAASSASGQLILSSTQKFFSNGARPGGILTAPQKITDDTAKRLREDWDANYSGNRSGKTAVLGEGLEYKSISMSAVDSQLIEQLRWSVEDVARVFRVPPFMIGDQSKVTYRNSEQLARTYLIGCLNYHLEGIVTEFNKLFEFGATMTMEFDLEYLLRTEIDVRYAAHTASINAGWKTINEVRRGEGLEPKGEEGDKLIVQGAMATLENVVAGKTGPEAQQPNSEEEEPEAESEPQEEEPQAARAWTYRGIWQELGYQHNDTVTHDGGVWLALRDTTQRPGAPDLAVRDWLLTTKRGERGPAGKTPTLVFDKVAGTLSADYGDGPQPVLDLRSEFREAVEKALRDAGVIK